MNSKDYYENKINELLEETKSLQEKQQATAEKIEKLQKNTYRHRSTYVVICILLILILFTLIGLTLYQF